MVRNIIIPQVKLSDRFLTLLENTESPKAQKAKMVPLSICYKCRKL